MDSFVFASLPSRKSMRIAVRPRIYTTRFVWMVVQPLNKWLLANDKSFIYACYTYVCMCTCHAYSKLNIFLFYLISRWMLYFFLVLVSVAFQSIRSYALTNSTNYQHMKGSLARSHKHTRTHAETRKSSWIIAFWRNGRVIDIRGRFNFSAYFGHRTYIKRPSIHERTIFKCVCVCV